MAKHKGSKTPRTAQQSKWGSTNRGESKRGGRGSGLMEPKKTIPKGPPLPNPVVVVEDKQKGTSIVGAGGSPASPNPTISSSSAGSTTKPVFSYSEAAQQKSSLSPSALSLGGASSSSTNQRVVNDAMTVGGSTITPGSTIGSHTLNRAISVQSGNVNMSSDATQKLGSKLNPDVEEFKPSFVEKSIIEENTHRPPSSFEAAQGVVLAQANRPQSKTSSGAVMSVNRLPPTNKALAIKNPRTGEVVLDPSKVVASKEFVPGMPPVVVNDESTKGNTKTSNNKNNSPSTSPLSITGEDKIIKNNQNSDSISKGQQQKQRPLPYWMTTDSNRAVPLDLPIFDMEAVFSKEKLELKRDPATDRLIEGPIVLRREPLVPELPHIGKLEKLNEHLYNAFQERRPAEAEMEPSTLTSNDNQAIHRGQKVLKSALTFSGRKRYFRIQNHPLNANQAIYSNGKLVTNVFSGPDFQNEKMLQNYDLKTLVKEYFPTYYAEFTKNPNVFHPRPGTSDSFFRTKANRKARENLSLPNSGNQFHPTDAEWMRAAAEQCYTIPMALNSYAQMKYDIMPIITPQYVDKIGSEFRRGPIQSMGQQHHGPGSGGNQWNQHPRVPTMTNPTAVSQAICKHKMDGPRQNPGGGRRGPPIEENIDDITEEDLGLGRGVRKRERPSNFIDEGRELRRVWTGSLNKLSVEKFDQIVEQLITYLQKCKTTADLDGLASILYEKCILEIQQYAELYGDVVKLLNVASPMFVKAKDEPHILQTIEDYYKSIQDLESEHEITMDEVKELESKYGVKLRDGDKKNIQITRCKAFKDGLKELKKKGKQTTFSSRKVRNFRNVFVDLLEETWEKGLRDRSFEVLTKEEEERCQGNNEEKDQLLRHKRNRLKSSLKFFGELYLRDILGNTLFKNVLNQLILKYEFTGKQEDSEMESFRVILFCQFFEQVGSQLESFKTELDKWMEKIESLKSQQSLDQMAQFQIQDLKDLRANGWRKNSSMQPSTLADTQMAHLQELRSKGAFKDIKKLCEKLGIREDEIPLYHSTGEVQYKSYYDHTIAKYSCNETPFEILTEICNPEVQTKIQTKLVVLDRGEAVVPPEEGGVTEYKGNK